MYWCLNFDANWVRQVNTGLFEAESVGLLAGQATKKTPDTPDRQSGLAMVPTHPRLAQIFGMIEILRHSVTLSASL